MSRRAVVPVLRWASGLALALAVLTWAGRGPLGAPPLRLSGWGAWLAGRDPVEAAFAVLRLAGLAVTWYLVAALVAGTILRLVGAASMVAVADRVTPAILRRLLAAMVAAGLAGTSMMSNLAAAASGGTTGVAPVPAPTTTTTPAVVMHRLGPGESPEPEPAVTAEAATPATPAEPRDAEPQPEPQRQPEREWTVLPGQCFWTIAESVLSTAWGRPPSDAEIVPYWNALIDANRPKLMDPGNADLIFPAQVFTVPPPPAP